MGTRHSTLNPYHGDELSLTLFEEAGDALFLFDPESEQLLDVNPMAQRLSGYSRQDLLRMQITYLFRSEVQGGLQRLRHAYRKTGVFHSQEGFLLRHARGGVWIPVNLTITRLHTEDKTLGLVTARDVREHREMYAQLQKAEAELRSVLSSVSDGLWSAAIDSSGKFVYGYYSPVMERITGRPRDYFASGLERWLSIVHANDRPRGDSEPDRTSGLGRAHAHAWLPSGGGGIPPITPRRLCPLGAKQRAGLRSRRRRAQSRRRPDGHHRAQGGRGGLPQSAQACRGGAGP